MSKNKKQPKNMLFINCSICNIKISESSYLSHERGKKHQKKLKTSGKSVH